MAKVKYSRQEITRNRIIALIALGALLWLVTLGVKNCTRWVAEPATTASIATSGFSEEGEHLATQFSTSLNNISSRSRQWELSHEDEDVQKMLSALRQMWAESKDNPGWKPKEAMRLLKEELVNFRFDYESGMELNALCKEMGVAELPVYQVEQPPDEHRSNPHEQFLSNADWLEERYKGGTLDWTNPAVRGAFDGLRRMNDDGYKRVIVANSMYRLCRLIHDGRPDERTKVEYQKLLSYLNYKVPEEFRD